MENEKEAVKRSMAQEAGFREEKQRIVESMGGSRAELVTPSADARIQRKLKRKPGSSLFSRSSGKGFQERDDNPGRAAPLDGEDLPEALSDEEQNADQHGSSAVLQYEVVVDSVAVPFREETTLYDVEPVEARRRRGPKFKKNTCYIAAAVVFAVTLGVISGVVVALVNGAAGSTSSPSSPTDEGTTGSEGTDPPTIDDGMCGLDREALAKCENGMLALPDCAADTYLDLANAYSELLVGTEHECDAAHQGLVALAVSQTNHAENVADPIMFLAMASLYFALEGTQWRVDTNWLEGSSPCSSINGAWYGVECSGDGSLVSVSLENNLLRGSMPTEIGLLSNLKDLVIGVNEISGPLPSEIGLLAKLWTLDISLTSIHSELPSEIGMLKELTRFKAINAPLTGSIPFEIGNMIKLEELHLAHNFFTGTLPTELGNLVQLHKLHLWPLSSITGTIPLDLVSLTKLEDVEIALTGVDPSPFPAVVSLATNLRNLHILDSDVTGSIPTISHLSHLEVLRLRGLTLTGTIPTEIGLLSDLTFLHLYSSNLGGTIPSEVGLLTKLSGLVITGPTITGTLPSELGALTALQLLDVSRTNLKGTIPEEACALNLVPGTRTFNYDICVYDYDEENCLLDTCDT